MKRLAAVLMVGIVLLSGCALAKRALQTTLTAAPDTVYTAEYKDKWAYSCLPEKQKRNYGVVYAALRDGFERDDAVTLRDGGETYCGISVKLCEVLSTEAEVRELYQALVQDNPSFFYVGNAYGYSGTTIDDDQSYDTLKLTYTMPAATRMSARAALQQRCDRILAQLDDAMTDFEKELFLHDALLSYCTYDDEAAADMQNPSHATAFSAYGALVEGKAVCEGYAFAMQYLLEQVGITATTVVGHDAENGEAHMWNAVVLDDEVYYLDPTWNDSATQPTYTFFNVTTADLLTSHRISDETIGVKAATQTTYNYYRMTGNYLDTMEHGKIAEHVAALIAAKEDCVHLRFSPETYDNAFFFVENASWFLETVNDCLPVGVHPLEAYLLIYDENYNTVTICKKPLDSAAEYVV